MTPETSGLTTFRGYKTEIDPTTAQVALFRRCAGVSRWAYNWGLQRKIENYRARQSVPTTFDLEKS